MNLKTLIQIFLSILTISITILFFFKYFYNVQETEELVDIKKDDRKIIYKETTMDIIENLRFENTDVNGNKFLINAKYGEINTDEVDVLNLQEVTGIIYMVNKSPINIYSDFAKYNKINFETIFYDNVKINYEENSIKSDNLEIKLDKNLASINGNVVYNNTEVVSYADNIEFNLLKENVIINMFDKEDNIKINRK
tara:strand:- start:1315 stop:1902 length:588 start_codon:yes stop_codon:yes gene_type:complete